jgi:hypothetical protein
MKRFTDTLRFADPWYYELPIEMKMAWEFIWASCDNAGVWNPNTKLADTQIGKKVDWNALIDRCAGRIVKLDNGRWFLPEFVAFQCGVLSENCRPHLVVIGLLRRHGLMKPDSLQIEYPNSTCRVQYKYKEKDQDKDKEQDKDGPPRILNKARGTERELVDYCISLALPSSDGETLFAKWEGNGWKVGGESIKDWKATIRSWKKQGYMPSQKGGSGSRRNGEYPEEFLNIPDYTPDDPSKS